MNSAKKFSHLWLFDFAADTIAIICAYFATYTICFHSDWGISFFAFISDAIEVPEAALSADLFRNFYFISAPRIVLILTAAICILYALLDLYPGRRFIKKRPVAWGIILGNLIALFFFYAYFYMSRNVFHPRSFFGTLIVLNILFTIGFRDLMGRFAASLRARRGMDRHAGFLMGTGRHADYINSIIEVLHPHGMDIAGRVDNGVPFAELLADIEKCIKEQNADFLIVADPGLSIEQIMRILEMADEYGLSVKVLSDKMDVLMNRARLPVDTIYGIPLVHFDAPSEREMNSDVTRILSLISAGVLLFLLAPFMLLIALAVKLTSPGPVFFIQERIGVNRKPFIMFKFRTMHDGAEEARAQMEEFNESDGALFKIKNDPRVTPAGRFLRRFSLDELPQLWNVIIGDMKIVGPRPLPRRDFENYYEEWHYGRHGGIPGLTCLWQVSGRSEIDFHNMCLLDVYYLRNHTWILDIKILLKTIWVVLFGRGAY